jgi:hypothetical protein
MITIITPESNTNLASQLRTPPVPEGYRLMQPDERTLTHDRIWDIRASQWIDLHRSFIGIRAGTFTSVIRPIK